MVPPMSQSRMPVWTAVTLGVCALPMVAEARLQSFAEGSLIIPMDACYQAVADQSRPASCVDGKIIADEHPSSVKKPEDIHW